MAIKAEKTRAIDSGQPGVVNSAKYQGLLLGSDEDKIPNQSHKNARFCNCLPQTKGAFIYPPQESVDSTNSS